jgi:hypothetical protein
MELRREAQNVSSMDEQRVPYNNKTLIFFVVNVPLVFHCISSWKSNSITISNEIV